MSSLRRCLALVAFVLLLTAWTAAPVGASSAVTAKEPFSEVLFNPCTAELFIAEGEIHMKTQESISLDGKLHIALESNLQNVKGVGLTTGARYVVQQVLAEHTNADSDLAPFSTNSNFLEHYIRQGEDGSLVEDDDFFLWIRLHLTVNATGVPTAERMEFEFDCR
jgi:hypothetical protein